MPHKETERTAQTNRGGILGTNREYGYNEETD